MKYCATLSNSVAAIAAAGLLLTLPSVAAAEMTVLRGARIYLSPEVPPLDDGIVLIENGKISAAGPKASMRVPAEAVESKCNDGVITAGFHNNHVHLTGPQFEDAAKKSADELSRAMTEMLTKYGFTTVTDTASELRNTLALRKRVESGEVRGPRILTVGAPLYPPAGIPFYLSETLPKQVLDQMAQPDKPDVAIRLVRENLEAGAVGTKLFIATPQRNQPVKRMPANIAAAAVEETHRQGRLAMTHPTDIAGIHAAVDADVDIVVHTTLGEAHPWPGKLIRRMVKQKVSLVPTLQLWPYELNKSKSDDASTKKLVDATLAELRAFSAAGGQVLFGTDVGYMTEFDPTVEYELMSKAGMAPKQILASLTTSPSDRWKESNRRGRIARGFDADLVVLEADPSKSVSNFAKVRCTIRAGKTLYSK